MERMKVLVLEPLNPPEVRIIPHSLEAMQELVGGNIECTYPWPNDNAGVIAAEDAIALGYPLNRALTDPDGNIYDIIKGTCFICGLSSDNFTDLPQDLIEKFSDMFRYPELYVREPNGRVLQIRIGSGEEPRVLWK